MPAFTISAQRRSVWRMSAILALALMAFGASSFTLHGDDSVKKEAVLRAWSDRQRRFQSVRYAWRQTGNIRLSTMLPDFQAAIRQSFPNVGEFLAVTQEMQVHFDGEKFGQRLSTTDGDKLRMPIGARDTYDGTTSQHFTGAAPAGSVGSGILSSSKHAFGVEVLYSKPPLLFFRPMVVSLSLINFEECAVLPAEVPVGNATCIVLEQTNSDNPLRQRYFLDVSESYIPQRFQELVELREVHRIDFRYKKDAAHGLVLEGWTCTSFTRNGEVDSTRVCDVTDYSINVPIPADEFRIDFPPGTYIEDRRGVKEGRNSTALDDISGVNRVDALRRGNWNAWTYCALGTLGLTVLAIIGHTRRRACRSKKIHF
ncbi:MAG: hypothetical protein ACKV0T_21270 [Planctomycetales bacterium]